MSAAQSAVTAANAEYLPTLNASGGYTNYDGDIFYDRFIGPPGLPPGGDIGRPVGDFDTTTFALLELKEVIYAGGARSAGRPARHRRRRRRAGPGPDRARPQARSRARLR